MSNRKTKKRANDQSITPPQEIKAAAPQGVYTLDAFQNVLARMGYGTPSMTESTAYPMTRITRDYNLMNSLYRSHWIVRRIIDVVPEDMCKNWYQVTSQIRPDMIEHIQKAERRASVKPKILEGLKWGRLYGGAAAVMMIEGHENILDQPLDYDLVFPGSFKGLLVADRWSGISPGPDLVTDINDPEFGLPNMYEVTNNALHQVIRVHHSRVLRFTGRDLPYWEKQAEVYWGASEVEHVYDELKKRDNTSWNMANLVFKANLNVLGMEGMDQVLSVGNAKAQQDLYNTIQAQNWLMNNFSMYIMGKDDKFESKQYAFSGLADVYECFMYDVSGAAEIPVTKLFGRAPAGLNSTGESDMQNYYDMIEERQEAYLRPTLDKLLPVMFMSELGAIPDDLDYRFNPVRRSSDNEKSDQGSKNVEAISKAYQDGVISDKIYLKELRQQSDMTGLFTNITDEDIEAASDKPNPMAGGESLPSLDDPLKLFEEE